MHLYQGQQMIGSVAIVYRPELSAGNKVQIVDIQGKTEVRYCTASLSLAAGGGV